MDQLKNHYEKLILGLAMFALMYVAYGIVMDNSEEDIEAQKQARSRPDLEQKKEMPKISISAYEATLNRLDNAKTLNLGNPHNLFNPVQWRVARDGSVIKVERGNEIGAGAIQLNETKPLYLKVEYRGATGADANLRYRFAITREASKNKKERLRATTTVRSEESSKDTRDLFTLIKIEGDRSNPAAFHLRLAESGDMIKVEKGSVFQRIDGYTATLAYNTQDEKKSYVNKRVGDRLFFAEDGHNIVAIGEREVVLSTASTSKRTTIRLR